MIFTRRGQDVNLKKRVDGRVDDGVVSVVPGVQTVTERGSDWFLIEAKQIDQISIL